MVPPRVAACTLAVLLSLSLSLRPLPSRAASKQPAAPAGGIGPFVVASDDERWKLALGLAVQLQYRMNATDLGETALQDTRSVVEARRIRPTLTGSLITRDLVYYLHLSTAPGALELMDWYLDYSVLPDVRARLGQWKIPFTRFRTGSFKDLTFVDWPITTYFFGAERQMGLALHNGYEQPPPIEYEAGIFTGVNARAAHAVGLASLYGEPVDSPSDLGDPGPRAGIHPELVAHLAYNHGGIDTRWDTDFAGGELRWSAGISSALDLDPDRTRDLTLRLAPEVLAKVRHLSLFGILYLGFAPYGDRYHEARIAMIGWLIQSSYLVTRHLELSARYAIVHMDSKVLTRAQDRARRLATADSEAGRLQREQEGTLGLNLYLLGRSLRLRNDMSWIHQTLVNRSRLEMRFRCQIQLVF